MTRAVALVLAACALGACGSGAHGQAADDGGRDRGDAGSRAADGSADVAHLDAVTFEALPAGVRAFDVTATVALAPKPGQEGDWASFPKTIRFTLAWDPVTAVLVSGDVGASVASAVTTTDDQTFHAESGVLGSVAASSSCDGVAVFEYEGLAFHLGADGALHGTASGDARYDIDDVSVAAPATFVLTGVPDVTAPVATLPTTPVDPMASFLVGLSEPLPATATASLVGAASGAVVALVPVRVLGPGGAVSAFSSPDVMLDYGETYALKLDGLADFAGNVPTSAPTLTTTAAPPLAAQDGFESLTTKMFAGAGVLQGGPLTPIAGTTSLVLNTGFGGGFGFLPYQLGSSLRVRLAVPAGATVVRFDSELVAADEVTTAGFDGAVAVGAVGQPITSMQGVASSSFSKVTLPQDGDVWESPVETIDLALPAGTGGEVTFEIVGTTFGCGAPPPSTVLILDDLRVE